MEPEEFVRLYEVLNEAIKPLSELIKLNPDLTEDIIRLAMVMGIHAKEKREFYKGIDWGFSPPMTANIKNIEVPEGY